MPRYVRKERLKSAIQSIAQWRTNTQSQTGQHLFPLLALLEKGVNTSTFRRFEEADDFDFFNRYFRVGTDEKNPYFDPLTLERRIASHPHSNVSTARKNTFKNRWQAAESVTKKDGQNQWKLSPDFADTILQRVMTRAGQANRPNVVDLAVWLFRGNEFRDKATAADLQSLFRKTFPMSDDDYHKLFEFTDEPATNLFSDKPLTADDINEVIESTIVARQAPPVSPAGGQPIKSELEDDDPILLEVNAVLAMNSSGIIFRGCPGTGKTWYAWNVALALTGNKPENIHRVQFHSSYGYEDFVEGYRPSDQTTSGFEIVDREFLSAVDQATQTTETVAFIVDEINRGDPARIFGEVLTYIEHGWREMEFTIPYSGKRVKIPRNLIVLATMNPHDRSVTQLDMALLRRFDQIDIHPSKDQVDKFLTVAGMSAEHSTLIVTWFDSLQKLLPFGIGHTYFLDVGDPGKLSTVWRYRMLPFCESVLEFEPERLADVKNSFDALQGRIRGQASAEQQ